MSDNGNPTRKDGGRELHVLSVIFDPEQQTVALQLNTAEIRTWDFVLALLKMAELEAMRMRALAMVVSAQQQAADQALAARVRETIKH